MRITEVHHLAIITADYPLSKKFYTEVLGFDILSEVYREDRESWKLDLAIAGKYCIELFSFKETRPRQSYPEACGLRHPAFATGNLDADILELQAKGVKTEAVRTDEITGRRFCFFTDPDGQPLELYET